MLSYFKYVIFKKNIIRVDLLICVYSSIIMQACSGQRFNFLTYLCLQSVTIYLIYLMLISEKSDI